MGTLAALVFLAALRPDVALPQDEANKSKEDHLATTAKVNITISAEGHSSLPLGSTIRWEGLDESCRGEDGPKNLESDGVTSVSLPVCKLKLRIFITGFDTKAVKLDLAVNKDRYSVPIHISVKHEGPAVVDWPEPRAD